MNWGIVIFLVTILFMVSVVVYGLYKLWKEHKELSKLEKEWLEENS